MDRKENNIQRSGKPETGRDPSKRVMALLRNLALPLGFSIVYPLAIFYGLRALGLDAFYSLLIGSLPIVGFQVYQFARKGKIDLLGMFVLAVLAISVSLAFITGSPRFMLAKAGFFTAIIGGGFFVSLLFKKPIVYTMAAYLLQRMEVSKDHLEKLWVNIPKFRKVWRVSTIIWGSATLLNAVIVLLTAYLLPIDLVPILNAVIHLVLFVILQLATNAYYKRQGIWKWVFHKEAAQSEMQNQNNTY